MVRVPRNIRNAIDNGDSFELGLWKYDHVSKSENALYYGQVFSITRHGRLTTIAINTDFPLEGTNSWRSVLQLLDGCLNFMKVNAGIYECWDKDTHKQTHRVSVVDENGKRNNHEFVEGFNRFFTYENEEKDE